MTGVDPIEDGGERLWARVRPAPPEQSCPEALELAGYIDNRLDPAAREAVEAHLAGCGRCLQAVADTRTLAVSEAPAGMVRRARALLGPDPAPRAAASVLARVGRGVAWPMAAAASIAACVIGYRAGAGAAASPPAADAVLSEMTFGVYGGDSEWLADELLPAASSEEEP